MGFSARFAVDATWPTLLDRCLTSAAREAKYEPVLSHFSADVPGVDVRSIG
jgi:hypothetical protein